MGEIENDHSNPDRLPNEFATGGRLADLTGRQLGRYLVQRQLGSGGVAMVYQAYDQVQGISVALKVLLPGADEKTHGRFRREALTAGALRHPHIVRILQVGTALQGEIAYIAMELVEGESLADLLATRGRLRPEESCNLLEPIARALHYAHTAGFVHRDVKPSNILLRPASPNTPEAVQLETLDHPMIPLLSDFGIARSMDSPELTSTGRTVGTPAYMAPEQCAGRRDADGRADVYSLGAVLYRCVVGHTPFSGTTTQILHAHVYEPLTIDDDLLHQLPYSLVSILQRSLAKKPEDRYATAEQMAEELARSAGRALSRASKPANTVNASEATGTVTLTSLPADATASRTHSTTVLVPAPMTTAPPRTQQALPISAAPAPVVRSGRPVPLSTLLTGLALLLLGLIFVVVLAFFVVNGFPLRTNQGAAQIPTATFPATATMTAGGPGGGVNGQTNTATPMQPPTTAPIPAAPSPTLTPLPTPTATPLPTVLPAPTPSPTEILAPTDTPAPTETATDVVLPSPTFVPTAPTPPPDGEIVVACTTLPDERLDLSAVDPALRDALGCAKEAATETKAHALLFQNGFMIYLEDPSELYVFYNADQGWFSVSLIIDGSEQGDPAGPPPPAPDLFVPKGAFGIIWQRRQLQPGLGYATQPEPQDFSAIKQVFNGGTVIGNRDEPTKVFIFLKTKEQ